MSCALNELRGSGNFQSPGGGSGSEAQFKEEGAGEGGEGEGEEEGEEGTGQSKEASTQTRKNSLANPSYHPVPSSLPALLLPPSLPVLSTSPALQQHPMSIQVSQRRPSMPRQVKAEENVERRQEEEE
eukprot:762614-Hanusia_phi.AAC.1